MPALTFTRTTQALGRNRWFTLERAELWGEGPRRWLDLFSRRAGKQAPVTLRFTGPADMRTLGRALLEEAEAWERMAALKAVSTERTTP